jgi:hypothetical protein
MIPALRQRFNREFTPDRYAAFVADVERQCGSHVEFRLSETPFFIPAPLLARLEGVAQEFLAQLLGNAAYLKAADAVVPEPFRHTHDEARPTFVQVDFGLLQGPNGIEARLVELQAFPSLYGFQMLLSETARAHYGFPDQTPYAHGISREEYVRLVRGMITGDHDPAEVVLLEIEPRKQKTWPDFAVTEQTWGVRAVDLREVERHGSRLFVNRDGKRTQIKRLYNRVIPDELEKKGLSWPFAAGDDIDVEWAGGPDWFFRISKFSIPWLRHPWVPRTHYLSDLTELPAPREAWLLKPLFSFAGGGIIFAPSDEQIAAIPPDERRNYILQERIAFTPVIDTPHGMTQIEIRVMMIRDGDGYRALIPLGRMGRGRMMGVDYNKGLAWVGAAAVLIG